MEISARSAYDREGRRKYLTRAEGQKFLGQVVHLPKVDALFCLTIYYTGCRISEALSLRRNSLDSETNVIRIQSLKKRGRKEIRRVPLPEFLSAQLEEIAVSNDGQRFWPFSRTKGWRIVKRVMADAGVSGMHATPKGLRHGLEFAERWSKSP